jgi:hypothetical protein
MAKPPVWNDYANSYVDPTTGLPLPMWDEAIDKLDDPDAEPAYVLRLGTADVRGINHGGQHAEKGIRYITKYVTKDLTEQAEPNSEVQRAHFDRLHDELSLVPCSPTCANWLLYGVQPDQAGPGLMPGRCSGKVHQRKTLGFTGRRVLISRRWSGKTLADHRADNAAWVRTVLSGALADTEQPDTTRTAADRYSYELARRSDPDVPALDIRIMRAIAVRERWRAQLDQALRPPEPVSATEITTEGSEHIGE